MWGGDTAGGEASSPGTPGSGTLARVPYELSYSERRPGRLAHPLPSAHHAGQPGPAVRFCKDDRGALDPKLRAPTSAPGAGKRRRKKINGPKATGNQNRLDSNRKVVGSSSARPRSEPHARLVKGESRARSSMPPDAHARLQNPTSNPAPNSVPGASGAKSVPIGQAERGRVSPSPRARDSGSYPAPGRPVPLPTLATRSQALGDARLGRRQKFPKARKVAGSRRAVAYLVRQARAAAPGRAGAPGAAACLPTGCPLPPGAASCARRAGARAHARAGGLSHGR